MNNLLGSILGMLQQRGQALQGTRWGGQNAGLSGPMPMPPPQQGPRWGNPLNAPVHQQAPFTRPGSTAPPGETPQLPQLFSTATPGDPRLNMNFTQEPNGMPTWLARALHIGQAPPPDQVQQIVKNLTPPAVPTPQPPAG